MFELRSGRGKRCWLSQGGPRKPPHISNSECKCPEASLDGQRQETGADQRWDWAESRVHVMPGCNILPERKDLPTAETQGTKFTCLTLQTVILLHWDSTFQRKHFTGHKFSKRVSVYTFFNGFDFLKNPDGLSNQGTRTGSIKSTQQYLLCYWLMYLPPDVSVLF